MKVLPALYKFDIATPTAPKIGTWHWHNLVELAEVASAIKSRRDYELTQYTADDLVDDFLSLNSFARETNQEHIYVLEVDETVVGIHINRFKRTHWNRSDKKTLHHPELYVPAKWGRLVIAALELGADMVRWEGRPLSRPNAYHLCGWKRAKPPDYFEIDVSSLKFGSVSFDSLPH